MQIEIRVDDLAFYDGTAVLLPVTGAFDATTPLLRRVQQAAGAGLAAQLRDAMPLPVGSAVVTSAGELSAKLLVLAVVQDDTEATSRRSVRRALLSALQRADAWALADVAMPPFGLGAGNLDIETSAEVMMQTIAEHARSGARHPATLLFVAAHDDEAATLRRALTWSAP